MSTERSVRNRWGAGDMALRSYVSGSWTSPADEGQPLLDAVTGAEVAKVSTAGIDMNAVLEHGRAVGGPALRELTFQQRAALLKSLRSFLREQRDELYALSARTGATLSDSKFDIDGGIGVLFSYASRGRRELPDDRVLVEGEVEQLGKAGQFVGQHILSPLRGVAVQINAFNFPVWGPLEKLAPAFLAGVPSVVKPASATAYLTHRLVELIVASGLLPEGALQLIAGGVGDLFVRQLITEMTVKAGQKCTAIRRAIVPETLLEAVGEAASERLARVVVGNPSNPSVRMGALASLEQREEVRRSLKGLFAAGEVVYGDPEHVEVIDADPERGAFISPILLRADADRAEPHEVEAFGPVSTLIGYRDTHHAIALAARGLGSLAGSVVTYDPDFAREVVLGVAPWHGRLLVLDRDDAPESTGHGSPLPMLVHGGPGRAGGGEELGGIRAITHHMQCTAVQASPRVLTAVTNRWVPGASRHTEGPYPFRKSLNELRLGESVVAGPRRVIADDIARFAELTGDTFYAHTDAQAAAANPFFDGIVAHGYLVVSLAAGLFVDPEPGPVLANYGIDNLRFLTPVYPGDELTVTLTCKQISPRGTSEHGEVRWDADVTKQDGSSVAKYDVLTMVAKEWPPRVSAR